MQLKLIVKQKDRQTDIPVYRQTDRRTDGQTDRQTDRQITLTKIKPKCDVTKRRRRRTTSTYAIFDRKVGV